MPSSTEVTPAEARELRADYEARVAKAGSPFRAYRPGEKALFKFHGTLSELYAAFGEAAVPFEEAR